MKKIYIITIVISLLIMLAGCAKQNQTDITKPLLDNKAPQANLLVDDYYKSLEIQIEQSPYGVMEYKDRAEVGLVMTGENSEFKKINIKGINMEISGFSADINEDNIEIKTGEETQNWLTTSNYDEENNTLKVVMISVDSMKEMGEIAKIIIYTNEVENVEKEFDSMNIYGEIADGNRIYKMAKQKIKKPKVAEKSKK